MGCTRQVASLRAFLLQEVEKGEIASLSGGTGTLEFGAQISSLLADLF